MSKLGKLGHFFRNVGKFAPVILALTPLAPIAGPVQAAIAEAEAIHGDGAGAAKLAHVVAIAKDAADAANAQAGHEVIDPSTVEATATQVVSTVVNVVNLAKDPTA